MALRCDEHEIMCLFEISRTGTYMHVFGSMFLTVGLYFPNWTVRVSCADRFLHVDLCDKHTLIVNVTPLLRT